MAMKKWLLFLFFPLQALAQPGTDLSGVWKGYLNNSQKKLAYEIVLSDSSGILTGFSRIIFTIKGEEYIAVKSLKISIENNKYILEEDALLFDNLQDDAPKKIRQINTLRLDSTDKMLLLTGSFKTKVEKGQRSASGDISLEKAKDFTDSKLLADLKDLKLAKDLPFLKKEAAPVAVAKPVEVKPEEEPIFALNKRNTAAPLRRETAQTKPAITQRRSTKKIIFKPVPLLVRSAPPVVKPVAPPVAVVKEPVPSTPLSKPVAASPVRQPVKKTIIAAGSAADIGKRSIETIQTVYFVSDSLKLTLYDNGEVDGDTVSVLLNGKVIMGKKGLSTTPITETIYMTEELGDSLQMIMYAENLGSIAPNTGLLIVQDGRDRYEIRFSGDLNKNAAIIFKRRQEE